MFSPYFFSQSRSSCSVQAWTAGLCVLVLAGALAPTTVGQSVTERVISDSAAGTRDVYAADLDGDGDTDVAATAFDDDKVMWYENRGEERFVERTLTTSADGAAGVTAADLSESGTLEVIVAAAKDSMVATYDLQGNEFFVTPNLATPLDVHATDLNDDGTPNIISGEGGDQRIFWYEREKPVPGNLITDRAVGVEGVFAADVNGDGSPDVLKASRVDDEIGWYPNPSFDRELVDLDAQKAQDVHATDLTGDGNVDILAAAAGEDAIFWYENRGGGSFSSPKSITTRADEAQSVTAADVTGNGKPDVLSASAGDNTIAWYENQGGSFSDARPLTTDATQAQSVHVADVDGDGTTDVLAASKGDDTIRWFEVNLSPRTQSLTENTSEDTSFTLSAPGILANDRDPDGDSLSVEAVDGTAGRVGTVDTLASGALLTIEASGRLTYAPNDQYEALSEGELARDSVSYTARDPSGLKDTATVVVEVAGVNDAPAVRDVRDTMTVEDSSVRTKVLQNDDDVDGRLDSASVSIFQFPTDGSVSAGGSGTITYTPDPGFTGTDRYAYTVADNEGAVSDTATVQIRVQNARPAAVAGLQATATDQEVVLQWTESSAADFDAYRVYRETSPSTEPSNLVETIEAPSTSQYTATGLSNEQAYYFFVRVVDEVGTESPAQQVGAVPRAPSLSPDESVSFGPTDQTRGYRMVGLPGSSDGTPLDSTLSGEAGSDWTAFAAPGITRTDQLVPYSDDSSRFTFATGRGFWVLSGNAWAPDGSLDVAPLDDDLTATVPLPIGWSIVTSPFSVAVPWKQVRKATPGFDAALWAFEGRFARDSTLRPYEGFYVFNDPDSPIDTLRIPFAKDTSSTRSIRDKMLGSGLHLVARPTGRNEKEGGPDSASVRIRIDPEAASGRDPGDHFAPPRFGPGLRLTLHNTDVNEAYSSLAQEARPLGSDRTTTFTLRLHGSPGQSVRLAAESITSLPDQAVYLNDREHGRVADLRSGPMTVTLPSEGPDTDRARLPLEVWVGAPERLEEQRATTVPDALALRPPAPNPASSSIRFPYTVPDAKAPVHAELVIYDVLGRTVRRLVDAEEEAGRHVARWSGRDASGRPVASGVYLCRFVADGEVVDTRKVTLVR